MDKMDPRLGQQKNYPRAMNFYVLTIYEMVLESKPAKILEIGTRNGQSTKTMLMALGKLGKGKLVSIDIKDRTDILQDDYPDLYQYWHMIAGNSHDPEIIQSASDAIDGEMYDMILIDGDHSYEGSKQDFVEYTKFLKPGGIVILHDTVNHNEGVHRTWAEIDWPEKFNFDWGLGRAHDNLIVGLGITKKPLEEFGVIETVLAPITKEDLEGTPLEEVHGE